MINNSNSMNQIKENLPNLFGNYQDKGIDELREELNKSYMIIEQLKTENREFQRLLDSVNDKFLKEINILKDLISKKDEELEKLKKELQSNNIINNKSGQIENKDKIIKFISEEQNFNFEISCSGNSIFAEIEEKLYQKYSEFRETNNTFLNDGKEVLRFKTINENNIESGKSLILVKPSS